MAERARAVLFVLDSEGRPIPTATITLRDSGTSDAIAETIYAADDPDTSQLTNGAFFSGADGKVVFYLTDQKRLDMLVTKSGYTSQTIPVDVQKSALVSGESVASSTIWDAAGDLAKGTGADTAARLARGTANQVLKTNSGGTDIEWGVEQSRDVITTAGDLVYGTAADTVARLGIGTAGQVLKVNAGATAPEWGAASSSGATLLGYALVTANQTGITTEVDLTGLTVTFTVPAGANQLIETQVDAQLIAATSGDTALGNINSSISGNIGRWAAHAGLAASHRVEVSRSIFTVLAAGTYTHKATLQRSAGTGSVGLEAGAGRPSSIVIKNWGTA